MDCTVIASSPISLTAVHTYSAGAVGVVSKVLSVSTVRRINSGEILKQREGFRIRRGYELLRHSLKPD